MKVYVKVQFNGMVVVDVPKRLSSRKRTILAQKLALAQILATSNNPDCGEALEAACEEFVEETGGNEADFDGAKVMGISGDWTLGN